jgi:hypothetical protein
MHPQEQMANSSVEVREGADPRVVVLVFSGAMGQWGMGQYDFAQATNSIGYSRILCRDPHLMWYHGGLDAQHPDIRTSADLLRERIAALAPRAVLVLGNSLGGYAAILFGHLLGADVVHAFAPQTCLKPDYVRQYRKLDTQAKTAAYERLWSSPAAARDCFDLNSVLARHNGRTTYFIHYCRENDVDRQAAAWIAAREGVKLQAYDCNGHMVARHIVKERLLFKILRPDVPQVAAFLASQTRTLQ